MRLHLPRHRARPECLALALLLAGCASEPAVIAVTTPIAPAPEACRTQPKAPPGLPDRELVNAELAQAYGRLKKTYLRETDRYRLCQAYVGRLGEVR